MNVAVDGIEELADGILIRLTCESCRWFTDYNPDDGPALLADLEVAAAHECPTTNPVYG